jgi:hypothetical protein
VQGDLDRREFEVVDGEFVEHTGEARGLRRAGPGREVVVAEAPVAGEAFWPVPVGAKLPTPAPKFAPMLDNAPVNGVPAAMNPVQLPNVPPVPSSMTRSTYGARAPVTGTAYSLTVAAIEPV